MKKGKKNIRRIKHNVPKECYFCKEKKDPYFNDIDTLQRFLTERGKIISRIKGGLCSMHQRALTKNIKYARHLALLTFVSR